MIHKVVNNKLDKIDRKINCSLFPVLQQVMNYNVYFQYFVVFVTVFIEMW